MSAPTPPEHARPATPPSTIAVISATGAFRLLLILLAIWTFLEGFALFTGGLSALSLGGTDRTAEQIIGAQMICFVPAYALLAWQRDRYRLLIWVPYGAQLAIVLPTTWGILFRGDFDGVLLLVVSATFFALLFYFWWHSHPLDFFATEDAEDDDGDDDEEEDDEVDDDDGEQSASSRPHLRPRDVARKPGRFRRRDG
jgi:hypothetical protein